MPDHDNPTTDLVEDAREAIGMLQAFPDGPDIEGRITARGAATLGRLAIVFTSVVDRLEEIVSHGVR